MPGLDHRNILVMGWKMHQLCNGFRRRLDADLYFYDMDVTTFPHDRQLERQSVKFSVANARRRKSLAQSDAGQAMPRPRSCLELRVEIQSGCSCTRNTSLNCYKPRVRKRSALSLARPESVNRRSPYDIAVLWFKSHFRWAIPPVFAMPFDLHICSRSEIVCP